MRVVVLLGTTDVGQAIISRLKLEGYEVTALSPEKPDGVDQWHSIELADPTSIERALTQIDGPFDAVVNATDWPPRQDEALNILRSRFFTARAFLDHISDKLAPNATIVNMSTRSGWKWRENIAQVNALMRLGSIDDLPQFIESESFDGFRAYTLANEAIIAMTTAKAEEMIAKGARINAVSPAAIKDKYFADFLKQLGKQAQRNVERVGRMGRPEEVAETVLWLLSAKSSWINGQNITVDGGIGAMISSTQLRIGEAPEEPASFMSIATSPSVVKRSLSIAAIVGLILATLNHGDRILAGNVDTTLLIRIGLTFFVPFCVSTYSSFLAVRGNLQRIAPPL